MNEWSITGNVAERLDAPRLRIVFAEGGGPRSVEVTPEISVGAMSRDGRWNAISVEWVDVPPVVTADNSERLAADLSRLMREAMDAFQDARKEAD